MWLSQLKYAVLEAQKKSELRPPRDVPICYAAYTQRTGSSSKYRPCLCACAAAYLRLTVPSGMEAARTQRLFLRPWPLVQSSPTTPGRLPCIQRVSVPLDYPAGLWGVTTSHFLTPSNSGESSRTGMAPGTFTCGSRMSVRGLVVPRST